MKFSLLDLQKNFECTLDAQQVADHFTRIGLEVDAIEEVASQFEGVVVGKVLETQPHPNADRLLIAQVDIGEKILQIVCGASNCKTHLLTAVALEGAQLKDAKGKTHEIKRSTLRGVESFGMLVSKEELGLEEKSEGIIELDDSFSVGQSLSTFCSDTLLEISFTPNLGHAMSLLGITRELSCALQKPFSLTPSFPPLKEEAQKTFSPLCDLKCSSFDALILTGLKVAPSPLWLQQKLKFLGYQSINNIVDATNYLLYLMGHPLHAYDLEKISLPSLCVQNIDKVTSFEALDGKQYEVPPQSLFVCDHKGPLSLAGIIGGASSQVTFSTHSILLEAAVFDSSSIRKTSRKLGLSTEASKHFERGVDPKAPQKALQAAAALILSIAGGEVKKQRIHFAHPKITEKKILCPKSYLDKHLGVEISHEELLPIFEHLEFKPQLLKNKNSYELTIPSYRNDLKLPIDMVEEVARFYGFDRIELTNPRMISSPQKDAPLYQFEKKLHSSALQSGLQEIITCDLISPEQSKLQNPKGPILQALNSVSNDQSILRSSLLSNHLEVVKNNLNQNTKDLHFFEVGKTYTQQDDFFEEESVLAITLSGNLDPYHFEMAPSPIDFFHLKGIFENIHHLCNVSSLELQRLSHPLLHPYRAASWSYEGKQVGYFGEVHPRILRTISIKQKVFFGEISIPSLLALSHPLKEASSLCPYPSTERDWTFTCLKELEVGHLIHFIHSTESRLLKSVFLLNIYESEKIGTGNKNVSLRFVYRNDKKTISFEATEVEHARILNLVLEKMKTLIVQPI